uniref:GLOBIN domain-containing protein n=1 Tax=Steinernema glaseri TaxID=37863 RepID=A0A1I7Z8N5_9BILA
MTRKPTWSTLQFDSAVRCAARASENLMSNPWSHLQKMFLIAKIVRGRRLLHELEQEEAQKEAEEAAANLAKENGITSGRRHRNKNYGQPGTSIQSVDTSPTDEKEARRRRKKTVRQKTETSLPSENTSNCDVLSVNFRVRRTSSMPSVCESIHKSGVQIRHYNYETKLSKLQKRSLRFTWQRLHTRNGGKRVENVFEEVYDRLVKQLPIIRDMFTTRTFLSAMSRSDVSSLRDHARVTVKMIDTVIRNLDLDDRKRSDTNGEFDPRMIGRKHGSLRPYGFNGNIWEKLGETMIDVVLAQEAVRDLPGAGQAWVVLIACLVDQLRAGFEETRNFANTFQQVANQQRVLHNAAVHLRETADGKDNSDPSCDHPMSARSGPVCPYMIDQNGAIVARRRPSRLSDGGDSSPPPEVLKPKLSIPTR